MQSTAAHARAACGSDHGPGELDRHVAQAPEADDARGARRALGLGAEVGQGRVGRDAWSAARLAACCAMDALPGRIVSWGISIPLPRETASSRRLFGPCGSAGARWVAEGCYRRRGAARPWRGRWRLECESRSPRPPPPSAIASVKWGFGRAVRTCERTNVRTDSE